MRFLAGLTLTLALATVSPAQLLSDAGSLAHFQSGGGWRTTFYLFNTGQTTSLVQLNFYDDKGQDLPIPIRLTQVGIAISYGSVSQFKYTLNPGSVLQVESDSSDPTGTTGWAKLQAGSNVTGYLIFRYAGLDGTAVQEAVVTPETRSGKSYLISFDNTGSHFTSAAVANLTNQPVDIAMTARDALTGLPLGPPIVLPLPALGHRADLLKVLVANTANSSGTIEFTTPSPGQIAVLGLRFTTLGSAFALTSTPPILKQ